MRTRALVGGIPWTLLALAVPALLFGVGLCWVRNEPGFDWLGDFAAYPVEFWIIAVFGTAATIAGVADWRYHRSGKTAIGGPEHHSELMALGLGGLPLFGLMTAASILERPQVLLVPVVVVALFTAAMICYDEFVFHRKRCGRYETCLHRVLVFGHTIAWLAWMNWCFVRGGTHG